MIYYQSENASLLCGDCLAMLKCLPEKSVNCCVTSPPYFGLRDYNVDGQIGLEPTPDEFVQKLVSVFREVKRVLRDDGTLWLNLGDSYASYRDGKATPDTSRGESTGTLVEKGKAKNRSASTFKGTEIKHKDLIGIPWRVAFALQADGWYLRQDIIWHKPNPMPESVKDRCTKAHEYIFLLSKSQRYYFDSGAIKERATGRDPGNKGHKYAQDGVYAAQCPQSRLADCGARETRNRRSVWTVATRPFKGAHFATFPLDLIEPCILAGCPKDGLVIDPFNGAGTVGVAAMKHSRKYLGIELNPDYCKITLDRWGVVNA